MLNRSDFAHDRSRVVGPRTRRLGVLSIAALGAAAWAQTGAARDPADAAAPVPRIIYASPLPGPSAAVPASVGSWREANDLAGRIGGWRAYAREAQERAADWPSVARPAPPAPPASAPATPPRPSAVPVHKH